MTTLACFCKARNSRYPSGSIVCKFGLHCLTDPTSGPGPWMNRKNKGQLAAQLIQCPQHWEKDRSSSTFDGTVQIHEAEPLERQPVLETSKQSFCLRQKLHQCVDHHVPDEENLLRRDALALQIFVSIGRRREQKVRELIGDKPVDLFRHLSIERPKPASTCADLIPSFAQTNAAATVD